MDERYCSSHEMYVKKMSNTTIKLLKIRKKDMKNQKLKAKLLKAEKERESSAFHKTHHILLLIFLLII